MFEIVTHALIWGQLGVDPTQGTTFLQSLTSYGAFIVALCTAGGFIYTIYNGRKKERLAKSEQDAAQSTAVRSVSVDEIEAAIPGLGGLVTVWQKQANDAFKEIEQLRKNEDVDRKRIVDLEIQVKLLTQELVTTKTRNIKLEERIEHLETQLRTRDVP